ncbi:MAG: hypothetical protein NW217_01010 [Hyphomicrobiaceae bacterium]|nr:hypothetical protein [Hyphomicrobiaceae bacterium]
MANDDASGSHSGMSKSAGTPMPPDAEIRQQLKSYFSGEFDRQLGWLRFYRQRTREARAATAAAGLLLLLFPPAKYTLTATVDWPNILQADAWKFLLPGALLLAVSLVNGLWSGGSLKAIAVILAIAAADIAIYGLAHNGIVYGLVGIAAVILAYHVYDRWRHPEPNANLESEIDAWIDAQFNGLIAAMKPALPVPAHRLDAITVRLRSFPKLHRLRGFAIDARVGLDGRPRISPVGLAAFSFGDDNVLVLEGAVDLWTGQPVYSRAHLFRYADIVALSWSTDASPPDDPLHPMAPQHHADLEKAVRKDQGRNIMVRRDELQIRLKGQHTVTLVFRDSLVDKALSAKPFKPITDIDNIRAVWEELERRKDAAEAGPAPAPVSRPTIS